MSLTTQRLRHPTLAFSDLAALGAEATLVPGALPRYTRLALWLAGEDIPYANGEVVLVLPAGSQFRRRNVPVRWVPLGEVLDEILILPKDDQTSDSVRAWSVATHLATELIARGRLTPGITGDGSDVWRLGPFDANDLARWHQLASALPAQAHCIPLDGRSPLRVSSPESALRTFGDAVADLIPRTAGAPNAAGHLAFASTGPHQVGAATEWFASLGSTQRCTVALRLSPPDDPGEAFEAELVLQSYDDPSLMLTSAELWDATEAVLARFTDAEESLLLALRRATRIWPPLERMLEEARPERIVLSDDECHDLLGPIADELATAGLSIQWPARLFAPVELRPTISTPTPASGVAGVFSLDALLEWRASLDGVDLTEAELEQLADAKRGIVRIRGQWVRADPARLANLRTPRRLGAGAALGVALGGALTIEGVSGDDISAAIVVEGSLQQLATRLRGLELNRDRPEPIGLDAKLRPYQRRGLAWLAEMSELGLGGVLADDMGLGKTIQVIALHLDRSESRSAAGDDSKPSLVVCPATLVTNWEREITRFAPTIPVRRYHGPRRDLADLAHDEIVVTTYGVVRRDIELLAETDWGLVVADEAQAIKNPHSRSAKVLRRIGSDARFALTGTPVENQLSELWAIVDWTTPGLLGPLKRFQTEIANPIERDNNADIADSLATLLKPFVLRRRKTDANIAPDLPPKTETDRFIQLTAEQVTLYRAVVDESLDVISDSEGIARRGLVLKLLTELKQICNHPAHFLDQTGPLAGRSAKLDLAVDLLDIVASEDDAALVFTQYVKMGKLLQQHLLAAGLRIAFLHGSLGLKRRQELIDQFQTGQFDVFVLSLKAGGTGLNLTRATHVVHYDRWWNPAVEDQASDRTWRIGQDRPVQIHRLICEGTIEERIASVLETKRSLADRVVGGGEGWASELDDDALATLVSLSEDGDE